MIANLLSFTFSASVWNKNQKGGPHFNTLEVALAGAGIGAGIATLGIGILFLITGLLLVRCDGWRVNCMSSGFRAEMDLGFENIYNI